LLPQYRFDGSGRGMLERNKGFSLGDLILERMTEGETDIGQGANQCCSPGSLAKIGLDNKAYPFL